MGYYTKHIFKIVSEHTVNDLVKLSNTINNHSGYRFTVYPKIDCIDDRDWNGGLGSKFYYGADILEKVSKDLPDLHFYVYCCGEEGEQYILDCLNGEISREDITEYDKENKYYCLKKGYTKVKYDCSKGNYPKAYEDIYTCTFDNKGNYIIND